eukprot:GEMP01034607.1.p1 GENE.GEMP01034607.1~~GEMP01034607.1.p1  ORF type:complete len:333 (+),score=67.21 GEMP01034607.1:944-1942(+)
MQGIPMARFAEKLASSELRIMMKEKEVRWVSFHGLCDFGFLVKFTYKVLPLSYVAFLQLMVRDFPRVVDLKYMLPTTSLAALGESLHVVRYGFPHTAGSDALFTLNCFLALDKHQQHYAFCYPMVGHFFALADDESATTPADADHDRISEFIRDAQEAAQERRERELQYPSLRASPDLISDDRTPDSTTQSNHSAWNSTQQQGTPRVPFDATSTRRYSGEFAPQFPADSDAAPATAYTTDENYTGEQQLVNAEDGLECEVDCGPILFFPHKRTLLSFKFSIFIYMGEFVFHTELVIFVLKNVFCPPTVFYLVPRDFLAYLHSRNARAFCCTY